MKENYGEWEKSILFNEPKLPFVDKKSIDRTDGDKEVSVHQENDTFSEWAGLIILPRKEKKKPLRP